MPAEYLLFVDTETTGLPARWDLPYAAEEPWPHVAQLAWQLYAPDGTLVKEENYFLQVPAGRMTPAAVRIHGITPDFLAAHGQAPEGPLRRLLADLDHYRPRVVGYFLQLDFHVIGASLHRAGLPNPLPVLPQFCLMRVTRRPDDGTYRRYQRLSELHEQLFGEVMPELHDARSDAAATARCFYELRRQGQIPAAVLTGQPPLLLPGLAPKPGRRLGRGLLVAVLLLLALLALLWITA
ncbi:3'-5' exonuclease [Hymenobacter gummosus]|uniref:3'-5' exonuclease n=1 Tax=Hymenobacter gummosus TaxID=1776032 RepID=A0A3S0HQ12_9BACT|nr:3'-5' exonuclease [Hymenobacter gummosus]RTQ51656.1 3'-5' exonuclease [Hymenobacter gummosus]